MMNNNEKALSFKKSLRFWLLVGSLLTLGLFLSNKNNALHVTNILRDHAKSLRNVTLPMIRLASEASTTIVNITENPYAHLHSALKNGSPLDSFVPHAIETAIAKFCTENYEDDYFCGVSSNAHQYCDLIQRNEENCRYWLNVKHENRTLDDKIVRILMGHAYGIHLNGTSTVAYKVAVDGQFQTMATVFDQLEMVRVQVDRIRTHAAYWLEFSKSIQIPEEMTRSAEDFARFLGLAVGTKMLYSLLFLVGPAPFTVLYYGFCLLVEINQIKPEMEISTPEGIVLLAEIVQGDVFTAQVIWRLLFVDLWKLLALELVALTVCIHQEHFSPLYWGLKKITPKMSSFLECYPALHSVFSALPSLVMMLLEGYRYVCIALVGSLLCVRSLVVLLVVGIEILRATVGLWVVVAGLVSTALVQFHKKSYALTAISALCFALVHIARGTTVASWAAFLPENDSVLGLEYWIRTVPAMWSLQYQEIPVAVLKACIGLVSVLFADMTKNITGNIVDDNTNAMRFRSYGGKIPKTITAAYYLNVGLSYLMNATKIAFWVGGILLPYASPLLSEAGLIVQNVDPGWFFQAGKMFLLFLSQNA